MLAETADRQREIIGERTLLQRRRRRLSQRHLSVEILGWGPNRVGQVERAETDLDMEELYALASALQCNVNYLLGIVESPLIEGSSPHGPDPATPGSRAPQTRRGPREGTVRYLPTPSDQRVPALTTATASVEHLPCAA